MPKFKVERVTETRDGKVTNDYYAIEDMLIIDVENWEEFKKIVNEVK